MTGTHLILPASAMVLFIERGYDVLSPGAFVTNIAVKGVMLGAWLRFREKDKKATSMGAMISVLFGGVTEPALYGVILNYRRLISCLMAGAGLGGLYAGIMNVYVYSYGVPPILYPMVYTGGGTANLVNGTISCVIAFIASAAITYFFGKVSTDK